MLLQFRVDVALVEGPVSNPQVEVKPWREDELVIIAPPEHPLRHARVDVAALAEQTFLVRELGSGTRVVSERAAGGSRSTTDKNNASRRYRGDQRSGGRGLGPCDCLTSRRDGPTRTWQVGDSSGRRIVIHRMLTQIRHRGRVSTAREFELILNM